MILRQLPKLIALAVAMAAFTAASTYYAWWLGAGY